MKFTQKFRGARLVFEFKDERLVFTHDDASGERSIELPYEQIDVPNPSTLLVRAQYVKYPERYGLVAGGAMMVVFGSPNKSTISLFWAIVFFMLAIYHYVGRRRGVKYTFFKEKDGKIRVMQDKQHDVIVAELKRRWIAAVRKAYGSINMANDPAKELSKFQWLKSQGVISEQEFEQVRAQIRALQVATTVSPSAVV